MKTDGMNDVLPLSTKQKYACNIVMGAMLLAAGVILILSGTGVINTPVRLLAAPTILFAFGAAMLFSAIIAKNSLSMWLAGVVLACGFTSLFAVTTTATYANLYPIYIASPGIGCCFAIWYSEAWFPQIKAMAFFGGLAGIFSLSSSGACGWGLTGGILAAFGGVCVLFYAVSAYLRKEKENA